MGEDINSHMDFFHAYFEKWPKHGAIAELKVAVLILFNEDQSSKLNFVKSILLLI